MSIEVLVVVALITTLALAFVLHMCLFLYLAESSPTISLPTSRKRHQPRSGLGQEAAVAKSRKKCKLQRWARKRLIEQEVPKGDSRAKQKLELPCRRCGKTNAKKICRFQCCATCCHLERNICRGHGATSTVNSLLESAMNHKYLSFDLSYAQLKICPANITMIGVQLTSLNLSNNQLSTLPEDIGFLVNLEELFLQYNCLPSLPGSVCLLRKLLELDAKNNVLCSIPCAIGNMRRLQILNLTNNHISSLPSSVGKLKQLEELSLHSNNLCELPDEICNAAKIRIIYAGNNDFRTLPLNFGSLVRLEELDVSGGAIEYLPESLSECRCLERLWLSNNRLSTLPHCIGNLQELKELHVRNNRLKYFPASIQRLHLYTFTAQNNNFIHQNAANSLLKVPPEVIAPLLELAARVVRKCRIPVRHGSIPQHLEVMLTSSVQCVHCGEHLFSHYSTFITYETIGFYYKLPLYKTLCSLCHQFSN